MWACRWAQKTSAQHDLSSSQEVRLALLELQLVLEAATGQGVIDPRHVVVAEVQL
jgi:hypothetical protein